MTSDFGTRLRDARVRRDMTQRQVAESAGVSLRSVGQYEKNAVEPTWSVAVRLAQTLRVSLDALNGRDPQTTAPPEALAEVERIRASVAQTARAIDDLGRVLGA